MNYSSIRLALANWYMDNPIQLPPLIWARQTNTVRLVESHTNPPCWFLIHLELRLLAWWFANNEEPVTPKDDRWFCCVFLLSYHHQWWVNQRAIRSPWPYNGSLVAQGRIAQSLPVSVIIVTTIHILFVGVLNKINWLISAWYVAVAVAAATIFLLD